MSRAIVIESSARPRDPSSGTRVSPKPKNGTIPYPRCIGPVYGYALFGLTEIPHLRLDSRGARVFDPRKNR